MERVFIAYAGRTAIGKFLGSLAGVHPADMAAVVLKDLVARTGIDPAKVDEVIVGNVLCAGQKQGVARQASVAAGIPYEIPAWGVNMICGSGLKSVMTAYNNIRTGEAELIIAGGTESMSGSGFITPGSVRAGHKMGPLTSVDHMVHDGLTDAFSGLHMGITAENVAEKYGITREEQDLFSYLSQRKAVDAINDGKFRDEIVPIEIRVKKETVVFDTDEFPNRSTDPEKLAKLRPAFKSDGTVTAGNSSGINDGAAFVLVASEKAVEKYGLEPLAEITAAGQAGVDPAIMGMGPVPAIREALKKTGLGLADIDLLELNEAFAAQSLGVVRQLEREYGLSPEWIMERTNVNGGAIALGHPIGASGARILVTLLHEMKRSGKKRGLASLCIGGGMGTAVIVERV